MRKDKEEAFKLRRQNKSYKSISRELSIPVSTLADWFKNENWSMEIRDRLAYTESMAYQEKLRRLQNILKAKYDALHESYRKEAIDEFPLLKSNPLFTAGIMLYWGEGDKNVKNCATRLTNSDPGMIRTFYLFLTNAMRIPKQKISFSLLLYPDLIDSVQKNFWSQATGIPLEQFKKSVVIRGRHPTRRLAYGVGMIRVGGRRYKEKLLKWVELYMRELNSQTVA